MCQSVVTVIFKGDPRNTCPDHPKSKLREETGCGECGWDFCGGIERAIFAKSNKKEPIEIEGNKIEACPTHKLYLRKDIGCPECHWAFLSELPSLQVAAA